MKKQIFLTSIMLILVVTLFSLILIGGADLFKKDKGLIKISKQKFEWKIISQEKDLYKVEIADKLKKDTEICFYKKDAKSLSDLDNEVEIKNKDGTCIKDKEKGKDCIKLPKKAVTKEKEKYGYCYTNKEIEYLSFNPIVVWQEISAVDYYYNDINISTTLERCDEFRENCGIAYPSVLIVDSEKLKFGAEDLESKVDSNYHYSFKSNKPFYKDNQGYYVQLDKLNSISNFFGITDTYEISRIDVNDICTSLYEGSEENITEIFNPNCQLNTYSVEIGNETYLDEITNETIYTSIYTYYLDVYFTGFYNSTEDRIFIDPLYTIAQTDVFASGNILNNVTVEANFSHLDVNDQIDTNGINWSSLVAYYPFDVDSGTTTYDYTGNNNDGTYVGNAVSNLTFGLYGNGAYFDGDSDYIALAGTAVDGVNPINLNESFAISFWINFADSRSTYLINNYEGVSPYTGNSILIHADPRNSKNFIRVHVDDNVHSTDPNGGTDLLLNTWYHVTAVRYKGDNVSIFINGNLDGSAVDITTGSVLSTRDWKIGSRANSPTEEEFKGKMDEVIFFNTSLTSQQIQDIYNNQSQRFKSQGTQTIKQVNITGGYNQINLTTSFNAFIGSNISARIGYWDVNQTIGNKGTAYNDHDLGEHWAEFDGDGDYISIGTSSSFDSMEELTFAGWVKPYSDGHYKGIINFYSSDTDRLYLMVHNNDATLRLTNDINDIGDVDYIGDLSELMDNWFFVSWTYNSTNVSTIYINGEQIGSSIFHSVSLSDLDDGFSVNLGTYDTNTYEMNGSIDEVMIFNSSLSSDDISYLYSLGRDIDYYDDPSLVSWWGFDKANSNDKKGNNDGSDTDIVYNQSNALENGLVSYWHFDEDYTDAMGLNDGTAYDNTNLNSAGVYNQSASFDGDGDYVDMGTSSSLELDGEFTLSAWINSNTNSELRTIAGKVYYGSGAKEWGLYLSSTGVIQSKIGNGTDVIIAQSDTAIDTQRWYHTVVTRNSSGYIILYMDGIAQSDTEILTGDINPNYHFYISRRASADTFHFNGSIDEVMVFNRSLSDDEIKELYVKGRAKWNYTEYQNLSNNGNIFNMSLSTTNLLTDFLMNAGNSTSNAFYTPNLGSGNITLDTMPPTYTLISPLNNSNFNNSNVNFTLNLSDNDGLLNATLNIYNSTGLVNQTVFTYVAGTLSATISVIINLIDNVYTWFLELWDVNGNQVFTPNQTFLVDTVYPNLNIISPTSYTNNNTIQLNTSDNYQHSSFIDLDKSLLNYLPFDKINGSGDPTDLSSYLNNGSLVNARITGDGYYGSGANFTGATDKIVIPNTGSLNFNTSNSYTWSMWAKYDTSVCSAVQATSCTLFSQSNGTTGGFYVFLYGSTIYFDDGFSTFTSPISDIVSNQWNHLVFIYNGTNLIGYLNGIKSSTVSIDSLSRNLTGNFVIGNGTGNAVYGLQGMVGQIDEFMIFNRSLSESEINSSFNSTAYQYLNNFSLSQNNHTLTAYAIDKGGNINSSYLNFTYDTINPQINITFPINNSWYNYNTVNINFTRSDTNLDSCWYSNDTYSSNTTLANCNNLTTIIWSQGNHNVTIWANDSAGNTNSSSITFNVDITNPLINFTSPTESSGVSKLQDFVYINTTWTETNFKNITFNIYNNTGLVNSTNYLTSVYLINFTNLTDNFNLYFYNVTICDLANNCNYTQTRNITLFNDNIAPSVLLVSPEDNSQDNDGVIRFIFNANDTNDIKNCSIYLQNTIYSTFYNITKNTNLLYEAVNTGDNPNINSNSLKWYVSCTDQYNNIGNSSIFNLDTFVQRQSSSDQTGGIGTSVIELNPKLVEIFYSTIWYTGEEQTIQIKTLNLNGIPYYVNNITFSSDIQNIKLIDLTNKENMTLVRFFVDENTKEGDYKINIKATDEKMLEKTAEISIKNKDSNIGKSPIIDFSSINNLLWIIIILLVIFSIIIIIILSVYFDKKRRISR